MYPLLCIYDVRTVFLGWNSHELLVASLNMKIVVPAWEAVKGMSLAYLPRGGANSSFIEVCNHAPWYYARCETVNWWRSFDAPLQDGAGNVSRLLLPMKEGNTSVMTICNQCPHCLPRMHVLKSLTLHWCLFPGWGREHLSTYLDHKGGRYMQKEYWRTIVNDLN